MTTKGIVQQIKKNRFAYYFIAPAVIGMLLLNFIPFVQGFIMSFLKLNSTTMSHYLSAPFTGLGNYSDILFNPSSPIRIGLPEAVRNTIYYTIFVTLGQLGLGIIVALMLNRDFRGRSLVRTLFLFPWIVPTFVTGLLWGFMWQQNIGIINYIIYDIPLIHTLFFQVFHIHQIIEFINNYVISGIINVILFPFKIFFGYTYQVKDIFPLLPTFNELTKPTWLIGPNTFWAIVIPTIWRYWPLSMLMLLAGLQNIPDELYEAASIDGASSWKKFWTITVPMLKSVWAILLMFGIIYNVYSFNIVSMMFGNGAGYPGEWGDLMMTNIFRNSFQQWQFGHGAAVSILFMIVMSIIIYFWHKFYISSEEIYR